MAKPSRSCVTAAPSPQSRAAGGLDRFFQITERGSTLGREIRGGLVTFFTMAYIVVLNPLIIGTQAGRRPASSSAAATSPRP